MEKYKIDFSEAFYFKGIRVLAEYLSEGVEKTLENRIASFCLWQGMDTKKRTIDFDFLNQIPFLKTFHCVLSLTSKSNVNGICNLQQLEELRWTDDSKHLVDLSCFPHLKNLTIGYSSAVRWQKLESLENIFVSSVKADDLSFLRSATKLKKLRINGGTFSSLKGIEKLSHLKIVFLQSCNTLTEVKQIVEKIPSLEQLNLENCKSVNIKEEVQDLNLKNISVIQSGKLIFHK